MAASSSDSIEKIKDLVEKIEDIKEDNADFNKSITTGLAIGIPVLIVVLLALALGLFCYFKRRRRTKNSASSSPRPFVAQAKTENDENEYAYYMKEMANKDVDIWKLDRSKVRIFRDSRLGAGAFCNVYKGQVVGRTPSSLLHNQGTLFTTSASLENTDVAVKMLPVFADQVARSDLMQEINFMKSLAYHPHLVSLIGWTEDNENLYLLVELCEKGDLLHFIRDKKDEILLGSGGLRIKDILCFSWQIATGLIADFGLCRSSDSLLYQGRGGRLPLRWMAPEALSSLEYSVKSDIWAYGVLLWELFTFGNVPFADVQTTDLLSTLQRGVRLQQPEAAPDEVYEVMQKCWEFEAEKRPSFSQICQELSRMLEKANEDYGYLVCDQNTSNCR